MRPFKNGALFAADPSDDLRIVSKTVFAKIENVTLPDTGAGPGRVHAKEREEFETALRQRESETLIAVFRCKSRDINFVVARVGTKQCARLMRSSSDLLLGTYTFDVTESMLLADISAFFGVEHDAPDEPQCNRRRPEAIYFTPLSEGCSRTPVRGCNEGVFDDLYA